MKRFYFAILLFVCSSMFVMGQRRITEEEWDDMPVTKPIVLEFYADWCAPCRTQATTIAQIMREFPEINFYKVDIERDKDWFENETKDGYIPMIQFWYLADARSGKYYKSTVSGLMSYNELRDSCKAVLRRYNDIQKRNSIPQKMSTHKSDTLVDIRGEMYHLALSGAVDMGTGILWAAHNLGATRPEQAGEFYAWGEVEIKTEYTLSTYKYGNYNRSTNQLAITKYNPNTDRKYYLQISDDAASQKWGGKWRMPDRGELYDLLWSCEWDEYEFRGAWGLLAYNSRTKNAIFFPAVGCMTEDGHIEQNASFNIWSMELSGEQTAYSLVFDAPQDKFSIASWNRYMGFSVRPVYDK